MSKHTYSANLINPFDEKSFYDALTFAPLGDLVEARREYAWDNRKKECAALDKEIEARRDDLRKLREQGYSFKRIADIKEVTVAVVKSLLRADTAPAVIDVGGTPEADPWAKARKYVEAATLFQRASLAAQIMAGLELDTLRKTYDVRQGKRSDLNFPHGAGSWPKAVKKHLGVSDDTARRWMEMAREARKRLKKSDFDLGAVLEKNPAALTGPEQELLKKAVHKISDGKTQMEFLLECGVTKAPQGHAAKGRPYPAKEEGTEDGADTAEGEETDAPATAANPEDEGWEPITKKLNGLLVECLGDNYWNDCSEARRRELHGNLLDAARAVAETLPKGGKAQ